MSIVYAHRRKDNGEIFYIGMGVCEKRANRFSKRNRYWNDIYNEFGAYVDVLATDLSVEDAEELEMFLIQEIGIDNLTNITRGGQKGRLGDRKTKEERDKISKSRMGIKFSQEQKDKISKSKKGQNKGIKNHKSVQVYCGTLDKTFECIFDCAVELGYSRQYIQDMIKGRRTNKFGLRKL
jgi:hypothetical protein